MAIDPITAMAIDPITATAGDGPITAMTITAGDDFTIVVGGIGSSEEEIDDLWGAHTDRTVPFDRRFGGPDRRSSWCTFDHGVACGTDRSGTHGDHRKGTRIARAPLPCRKRARSDEFRPPRTYTCPLWVKSGRVTGPRESPLWQGKRKWAGEESLQTDLQTNHTTRHGIEHHRTEWS